MSIITDNPIKILLGSAGSIIAVVTALFAIDGRYAHAADVERDKKETQLIIQQTTNTLRRQMLEDKLFELDVKREQSAKQKLSPIDAAMKERYKRQLNELPAK
jgi:hypothetical protein